MDDLVEQVRKMMLARALAKLGDAAHEHGKVDGRSRMLAVLRRGPMTAGQVAKQAKVKPNTCKVMLSKWVADGTLRKLERPGYLAMYERPTLKDRFLLGL